MWQCVAVCCKCCKCVASVLQVCCTVCTPELAIARHTVQHTCNTPATHLQHLCNTLANRTNSPFQNLHLQIHNSNSTRASSLLMSRCMGSYPGILRQRAHNTRWVPRRCGLPGVGMRVRVCARACVHFPTCTCMSTPSKVHVCACTHVCPPNLWEFRGNEEGGREGWGPMAAMAQPRYM